ncbi:MAG: DUF4910 domain-containing protein [Promethearchaeota archaeon]
MGYNQEREDLGNQMYNLIKNLYPICRSITGDGVRDTFKIIKKYIPLEIFEVPSGTKVFDWTVPKEWNIKDAYIKNSKGEKIIDFNNSNLHILNYSIPINGVYKLKELKDHLFSLPDHPEWVPYLTTYYNKNWGFCLPHNQLEKLKEDNYEVVIDSELKNGSLTYGEILINGKSDHEILFSTYICHPSLCNDNLSGPVLLTFLIKQLIELKEKESLNYSYRFLFIPETIGAICWLSLNEKKVNNIKTGLVVTCVGDSGYSTYKRTRRGDAYIDKIVEKVLIDSNEPFNIIDFFPSGSDERQYSSPGFKLSIGSLVRSLYGCFPEYHTSADNLNFVKPEYLANSFKKYFNIIYILENNKKFINLNPKCEPQLGKRGLYSTIGGKKLDEDDKMAMFWLLNLSDGENSLLDIAIRSNLLFSIIKNTSDILVKKGLLKKI